MTEPTNPSTAPRTTVRMIGGIREADHKDPLGGLWLQAVAFPMSVTNYDALDPGDPDEITVHDEADLRAWADSAFDELGYEIFGLEIPVQNGPRNVLTLISVKKAEYEKAKPSTPEGAGERDAVIAALDTLEVHARALLTRELSQPRS